MTYLAKIGRMFAHDESVETVATKKQFPSSPAEIWSKLRFYEEIRRKPPLALRLFLPVPMFSQGDKTTVSAEVRCVYSSGYLRKRIISLETAKHLAFEVCAQKLGIEDAIAMTGGSYEIRAREAGAELTLTTHYRSRLHPRWLWRPLEHYLAHEVHLHILTDMRDQIVMDAEASKLRLALDSRKDAAG